MKNTEIKTNLSRIADELLDAADLLPDAEARALRKAIYIVEDIKTSQAVGELVQVAAHRAGAVGPMPFHIMRQKQGATAECQ